MLALQGSGQVVHLQGRSPLDEKGGNVVGRNDRAALVYRSLGNIALVLAGIGGRMEDVYALLHNVTDIEAFMKVAEARTRCFAPPYPVTSTVEVGRLYHPDLLVETTASAEIPAQRYRVPASGSA